MINNDFSEILIEFKELEDLEILGAITLKQLKFLSENLMNLRRLRVYLIRIETITSVLKTCNEFKSLLVFTGIRNFRLNKFKRINSNVTFKHSFM